MVEKEHLTQMIKQQTELLSQLHEENKKMRDALSKVLAQVRMRSMQRHILEADEVQWVSELLNKGDKQ